MNKTKNFASGQFDAIVRRFERDEVDCPVVLNDFVILPGFCDVHVHLREPGFFYKESIATGTRAAAAGGYTTVCAMPNLNPVPDSLDSLRVQLDVIARDAIVEVVPYGAITKGEKGETLSDMAEIAPYVCAFSDDGRGVQSEELMLQAMTLAASLGKVLAAHCEDNSLLFGGYVHDGEYARAHNHKGICSESEYAQIERDLALAKKTGVKYHVCHVSAKESVALIRKAKAEGVDVTCETAPHYLTLTDADLREEGRFKMNPPLRDRKDRDALIEGIIDGTVDMIATDHAPHAEHEKSLGLAASAFGITGLETAFPVLYTTLVREGIITLEQLSRLLSDNARKRFSLPSARNDYTVFEIKSPYKIDSAKFNSKGKSTPFDGQTVYGKCMLTVIGGKTVWKNA